ncbi:hypothetical protein E2562_036570 [Oryza meyeriana var. granulata]|uniref:Uncharacterized protein n=1 Tax=Oryza meyeriana var. granulata TaxID=110450 RepID=A0A6G1EDC8_9ORYZ|nr:hypothetical protein E2562_036570 [Oryza meyeriana var. granulata]
MEALEAAFDQVMVWLDDEVMDKLLGPESVADDLAAIGAGLERVQSNARTARAALAEAAELLREVMDAAKTLFEDAFATVPARDDPDHEATLAVAAAAKLVANVFSEAPVLPAAIGAAMDLVAGVYALPPSEPGTLQGPRELISSVANKHHAAGILFADCAPLLGIQEDDEAWHDWVSNMAEANVQSFTVEVRLQFAICEVQQAVLTHRLYHYPRLLRMSGEVRAREAWKVELIVSTAIEEVDAALDAIRELRETVAAEEQIVLKLIDDAPQGCSSM